MARANTITLPNSRRANEAFARLFRALKGESEPKAAGDAMVVRDIQVALLRPHQAGQTGGDFVLCLRDAAGTVSQTGIKVPVDALHDQPIRTFERR